MQDNFCLLSHSLKNVQVVLYDDLLEKLKSFFKAAKIWDTSDYRLLRTLDLKSRGRFYQIAVSREGLWLATMNLNETNIWNLKTGRLVLTLPSSSAGSWRPGGSELALDEPNKGLGLWSMGIAQLLRNGIAELVQWL